METQQENAKMSDNSLEIFDVDDFFEPHETHIKNEVENFYRKWLYIYGARKLQILISKDSMLKEINGYLKDENNQYDNYNLFKALELLQSRVTNYISSNVWIRLNV